jgi:hypothetical protein
MRENHSSQLAARRQELRNFVQNPNRCEEHQNRYREYNSGLRTEDMSWPERELLVIYKTYYFNKTTDFISLETFEKHPMRSISSVLVYVVSVISTGVQVTGTVRLLLTTRSLCCW